MITQILEKFIKSSSKLEQAVNTKSTERQKELVFQKNRQKTQTCINPY